MSPPSEDRLRCTNCYTWPGSETGTIPANIHQRRPDSTHLSSKLQRSVEVTMIGDESPANHHPSAMEHHNPSCLCRSGGRISISTRPTTPRPLSSGFIAPEVAHLNLDPAN